ncbi:hypothetical protein WG66_011010 [Moniliophthora roreri]|nr:hypothetical protein WG66_011010 [Moniliophthora roreri]
MAPHSLLLPVCMALSASQVEYGTGEFDASGTSEKTQTTASNHFQHTANSKSPGHVIRVTLLASVRAEGCWSWAEGLESGQRVLATLVGKVGVWDSETRSFVKYGTGEFDASGTSEKTQTTASNHFQHTANSKSPGHVIRVTLLASVRAEGC